MKRNRFLLALIALGIWANALVPLFQKPESRSVNAIGSLLNSIDDHLNNMEDELNNIGTVPVFASDRTS